MVTQNGITNNFTGVGTGNPKLVIPQKNTFPPAQLAMALAIEQWANNLTIPATAGLIAFSQTYSVSGTLVVASGGTGYLPPFFMPVIDNAIVLYAVKTEVRAGSCTINIEQNGTAIASGLAVAPSPTTYPVPAGVTNGDSFQVVVASVSSADGLSCSFFFTIL